MNQRFIEISITPELVSVAVTYERTMKCNIEGFGDYRKTMRINGWTWPPHPLEVLAWTFLVYFSTVHFSTLVPALAIQWQIYAYIIPGVALSAQIICRLVAMKINPGHISVHAKDKKMRLPLFDRNVHPHVIECLYCHICRVNVSPRTRHCSVCNKCIDGYDHHCFFLNNCVGSRNFRWFFANVVTAIIGLLLIVALALLEFVAYFTDKSARVILLPYVSMPSGVAAQFKVFYYPARDEGWLALVGVTALLGSVACALLIHLFISHCYYNHHRLINIDCLMIRQGIEQFRSRCRNARSYWNVGWKKSSAVGANAQGACILPLHVGGTVGASNGDNIELPYDSIRSTADEF